jgi:hypothetical protein
MPALALTGPASSPHSRATTRQTGERPAQTGDREDDDMTAPAGRAQRRPHR